MNRQLKNKLFTYATWIAVILSTTILFFLFGVILWNGLPAIDFNFLSQASSNFGASGGIIYQIAGSVLMVLFSALICLPVAIGTAIFKSEYVISKKLHAIINTLIYSLNGIPSVIFGIFGLILFVNILGMGISWIVGSIILAMMILPTVTLSTYHSINSIPTVYRESSLSLGLTKWQVIRKVLLPQGFSGAVTGLLIGVARAIGETAPIMFIATAFSGVAFPNSFSEPVSTLPTHILALAQQATNPDALQNAWGSSLVLVTLVVLFSISALCFRLKHQTISKR
ncbi:phosphate ABC transporter permease PstA [Gillisia hiemivivida]|uniref:Phosphate transport system permease protein PstA n=1 Tax=Gillisia hiemivivida TaxID=291190 RepID=A0A5C6ZS05_9FLAO|nr:phosphate ABC transporter permease PstA [Gillisia hiemivivida]TXD91907.1 phosphate ABC transporter permease PstA [Gillisia hiemivivida]